MFQRHIKNFLQILNKIENIKDKKREKIKTKTYQKKIVTILNNVNNGK